MSDRTPLLTIVGVDGATGGWVAVELDAVTVSFASAARATSFAEILTRYPDAAVVAIDIPIGLPDEGDRAADLEARKLLRGSASTVFPMPPRRVLEAPTYSAALDVCRELSRPGISQQAWALRSRIFEVEPLALKDSRVYEVHPEVSFRQMNGERPLLGTKHSWNGIAERIRLLESQSILLPHTLGAAGQVAPDDLLDAAAAAWSALRIATGHALRLPTEPSEQRAPAIWY